MGNRAVITTKEKDLALANRGCEIIEQPWESDIDSPVSIVAEGEDALVFISVAARRNSDSFPPEHLNQGELEEARSP